MKYTYRLHGVCASQVSFDLEADGTIRNVQFTGGCNGHTHGVAALARGMKVQDYLDRCKGIHCGARPTSCPDQLAQALSQAIEEGKISI